MKPRFTDSTATYTLTTPHRRGAYRQETAVPPGPLFVKNFAHADSGPHQPVTPAQIAFTASK